MSRILEMRRLEAIQAEGWSMMQPVLEIVQVKSGLLGSLMVKKGRWKINGIVTAGTLFEFPDVFRGVNYGSKAR